LPPKLLRLHGRAHGNEVALREKDYGIWRSITWAQYHDRVRAIALGLALFNAGNTCYQNAALQVRRGRARARAGRRRPPKGLLVLSIQRCYDLGLRREDESRERAIGRTFLFKAAQAPRRFSHRLRAPAPVLAPPVCAGWRGGRCEAGLG
jgi:hypothetical protein